MIMEFMWRSQPYIPRHVTISRDVGNVFRYIFSLHFFFFIWKKTVKIRVEKTQREWEEESSIGRKRRKNVKTLLFAPARIRIFYFVDGGSIATTKKLQNDMYVNANSRNWSGKWDRHIRIKHTTTHNIEGIACKFIFLIFFSSFSVASCPLNTK